MRIPLSLLFAFLFCCDALFAQTATPEPSLKIIEGKVHVSAVRRIRFPSKKRRTGLLQTVKVANCCYICNENGDVLKIDETGNKLWLKEFGDNVQYRFHVPHYSSEGKDKGVDVYCSEAAFHVSSDGTKTPIETPKLEGKAVGAIQLTGGDLLFFGSTTRDYGSGEPTIGWAAKTNDGEVLWQRTWAPELEPPKEQPKTFGSSTFHGALILPDETIAFVGQSGLYSKFGTGTSKLWVLKTTSEGKELAQAFVEDSQFNHLSPLPVKSDTANLFVQHWKHYKHPTVEKALTNSEKQYWLWQSRFDADLKLVSEDATSETVPPDSTVTGGNEPYIFPMFQTVFDEPLLFRRTDETGAVVQRVKLHFEEEGIKNWGTIEFKKSTIWFLSRNDELTLVVIQNDLK